MPKRTLRARRQMLGERRQPFRQRDITRAMKAARLAGFEHFRVEIEPNGKLVINTAREPDEREVNEWDGVGASE